jgi:polar amino acid transport system substrate-binding protein
LKLLALLSMLVVALPWPAAAQELRLVYIDLPAEPYIAGRGHEIPQHPGMLVELARLAATPELTLTLSRVPSRRLIDELRFARADGVLGIRFTAGRGADLRFPMQGMEIDAAKRVARLNHSLYRLQGGALQWDGRQLAPTGALIGTPSGFAVADLLKTLGADVVEAQSSRQLFSMLALGRISAVGTLDIIGDSIGHTVDGRAIEKLEPLLQQADYHVAVSLAYYANHGAAVERYWQRLAALRDQTYARLIPRYLADP